MLLLTLALVAPSTAQTLIDFDDLSAACNFISSYPARNEYDALGVRFEGPGPLDGGAILDECGYFTVGGYSPPNFLAFSDGAPMINGGLANDPQAVVFDPPVALVRFNAGAFPGGPLDATATDPSGAIVAQDSVVLGDFMVPVELVGDVIARVEFSGPDIFLVDDLYFESYADADGDGFDTGEGGDCDDGSSAVFPGGIEVCDGLDNDCNGTADDDAVDPVTFYADEDGDGVGDASSSIDACSAPAGYVDDSGDCDDGDADVFPGADELCDGLDNDCNGVVDDSASCGDGGSGDGDTDDQKKGCGCDSAATVTGGWLAVLLASIAVGRRRTR